MVEWWTLNDSQRRKYFELLWATASGLPEKLSDWSANQCREFIAASQEAFRVAQNEC